MEITVYGTGDGGRDAMPMNRNHAGSGQAFTTFPLWFWSSGYIIGMHSQSAGIEEFGKIILRETLIKVLPRSGRTRKFYISTNEAKGFYADLIKSAFPKNLLSGGRLPRIQIRNLLPGTTAAKKQCMD